MVRSLLIPLLLATVLLALYKIQHSNISFLGVWISYLFFLLITSIIPISVAQIFEYYYSKRQQHSYVASVTWMPGLYINILLLLVLLILSPIQVHNSDWLTGDQLSGYHSYSEDLYILSFFFAPLITFVTAILAVIISKNKAQKSK